MKKSIKLAAATLCMALGMVYSHAQTTNTNGVVSVTFAPQTLNISLTGLSSGTNGGAGSSFRIATKDVISALGFPSKNAKLLYGVGTFSGVSNSFNAPVFVVSSGSGKSVTNSLVSDFFSFTTNGPVVAKGTTASAITSLGLGMDSTGLIFTNTIDGSQLTPLTFVVQGFTSFQKSGAFNSKANGPGTANNGASVLVLNGTITAGAPSKKTISFTP